MEHLQIENKAARLKLNESVHKGSIDRLVEEIEQVFGARAAEAGIVTGEITNCIENAADTLEIEINSGGGSVLDGYVLYNAILDMRERGVEVTANVSLAASMASVIAILISSTSCFQGAASRVVYPCLPKFCAKMPVVMVAFSSFDVRLTNLRRLERLQVIRGKLD